ncbi:hypothetical protein C7212DRAFT_362274 [Tuber magnatum]|uniref:Uncharacterized protein n=1 Tax=Tuber magnatum TaxID=42249 RepID=A0A317SXG7_9PEZI|nr:hypothetical protein C7212DRAFT_362274 [Tuber magnatum]
MHTPEKYPPDPVESEDVESGVSWPSSPEYQGPPRFLGRDVTGTPPHSSMVSPVPSLGPSNRGIVPPGQGIGVPSDSHPTRTPTSAERLLARMAPPVEGLLYLIKLPTFQNNTHQHTHHSPVKGNHDPITPPPSIRRYAPQPLHRKCQTHPLPRFIHPEDVHLLDPSHSYILPRTISTSVFNHTERHGEATAKGPGRDGTAKCGPSNLPYLT